MECKDCTEHSGLMERVNGVERRQDVTDEGLSRSWTTVDTKVGLKLFITLLTFFFLVIMGIIGFQTTVLSKINSVDKSSAIMKTQITHIQQDLSVIQNTMGRIEAALIEEP